MGLIIFVNDVANWLVHTALLKEEDEETEKEEKEKEERKKKKKYQYNGADKGNPNNLETSMYHCHFSHLDSK
jgi:hypothetical protein